MLPHVVIAPPRMKITHGVKTHWLLLLLYSGRLTSQHKRCVRGWIVLIWTLEHFHLPHEQEHARVLIEHELHICSLYKNVSSYYIGVYM